MTIKLHKILEYENVFCKWNHLRVLQVYCENHRKNNDTGKVWLSHSKYCYRWISKDEIYNDQSINNIPWYVQVIFLRIFYNIDLVLYRL